MLIKSPKQKKVLIISASFGSGHVRAAKAVEKVLKLQDSTIKIESIDALDYCNIFLKTILPSIYLNIVNKFPWIWGYIYDRYNYSYEEIQEIGVRISEELKYAVGKSNSLPLIKKIKDFNPQVIVCTHFFPMKIAADIKSAGEIDCPLLVSITDYETHHYWISSEVDCYTVANEEMKFHFQKRGVVGERIKITGIPIDPVFIEQFDKKKIQQKLGLNEELPTVLLLGGAISKTSLLEIIKSLNDIKKRIQILAVIGNNKKFAQELRVANVKFENQIHIFGFVRNMHELMKVSDLVITKAGGLTVSESLVVNLPMLIFLPYPGQEQANANFLIESGAAKIITSIDLIGYKANKLLSKTEELNRMRLNCQKVAKPYAAKEIANIIFSYL